MFILGFIVAGLNYRFKWIFLPIISSVIFVISYLMYAEVLRENTYLSRTIEVNDNQAIVDKGLYSLVRHPMYLITLVLFLTIPFILNSIISFFIFLIYPFIIVKRINNEEKLLENNFLGYTEYKKKVKY